MASCGMVHAGKFFPRCRCTLHVKAQCCPGSGEVSLHILQKTLACQYKLQYLAGGNLGYG